MPVYRHNGDVYDIPQDKAREFESQFPDATVEVYSGNDVYDIPVGVQEEFFSRYSDASYSAPSAPSAEEIAEEMAPKDENRFGILGKMGKYMGSPSAYVPMPQIEEKEPLAQAEIDERAAMRKMLQESGTIDRMEEMEKEARKNKFNAFGEALAYTPQVSSFGVSSNIYKDTEEQLADAQRAMEASEEHRQNKAMEQTLDVALDKARAGEWGGIGENNVGNGVVDFGLGLWDSATRMSTWDFGVSDTLNGLTIAQVVKKWEEDPESLTATERNLLDAMGMATAVQEAYQDQVGIGYAVGESLPVSAGFMASMYLNPASGLGKSLARQSVKKYGRQSIAKNLARIGGDIAETAIMTATTGGGRVVADALDRINGQSTYDIDPETGIVMYGGQEDQKTVGEAVVKAIGSNFIENYSEALGEYFDPLLGMSRRLAAGGLRKINLDKWADALSDVQPSQMAASIRSLREKAKFGGVFGEIMEEEVGMALNAITVGDYTFSKEEADASNGKKQWIFDLENQLTTALSCAIMSGAITGVEAIGNVRYRREMERGVADAEKAARAAVGDEMIAQIDQASPEGMVDILRDAYMDQNLSLQQKRVLAEYATQRVRMQYYNAADAKARRQVNVAQQNTIDAYEAGRHAQLPQYYNIDQEYRRSEAAINERENAEEIWDAIRLMNNMDENERQNIMRDFSEEDQELIRNWRYNAYRWQGAINHRAEQVEDLVDEYAGQVNPYVVEDEQGNRNVTTAVYGDNVVYVMAQNADGATTIVTNDGRKKMVNANELEHVQTRNADELIERFRQQTTEVVNQETEKNLSYPSEVLEPAEGVTVETLDGKQWQVAATDGENVEIVGLVFDKKSGQWIPNSGDYRKMTREQFMDWQKSELDRKKANTYEQGDELTFYVGGEPISAEITGIDPEGNYYVHVSNLVEGLDKAVSDVYTAEELRKLTTPSSKVSSETTENEGASSEEIKQSVSEEVTNGQVEDNVTEPTAEVAESVNTALSRVPKDAKGNPFYEQTDADTAWDAIVEQTEGNVEMAQRIAEEMVADKKAALTKMQKGKPKKGATVAEKIANEKAHMAAIAQAEQEVAAWEKIAQVNARRVQAEELARAEAEKAANEARKAEEARILAEQEEQARKEREELQGVPDMVDDTPQDARARGYRRVNGHKVERQGVLTPVQGKEIGVKFSNDVISNGRVAVIEAEQLQPSHLQGVRNPAHFIDEAQPKERNDEASVASARKIASNIRPEEITSSVTAYTGAPTVNMRGEAIQGNSRSDALRVMWAEQAEQAAKYKQYLIDHAEEFGLNAEEVAAMEHPVLVNMLDVSDTDAINLGQYVAQDTESGGTERIKPKNVATKMGKDIRSFANILLNSSEEELSFAELVDKNGVEVLKWMNTKGYITPTQYASAFDSKGNLTAEAKNDLRGILYQSIFQGGNTQLEEQFNALPAKAQKAILATAYRDYDSPDTERMVGEIQSSIRAFYALSHDKAFVDAKNYKDAKDAMLTWSRQYQMDDVTGESFLPSEKFSNFALELAVRYKGNTQTATQNLFNELFDLVQGTKEASLFEEADNRPRTLAEAIKETLNINYNGQNGSNALVGDDTSSQEGRQGSGGDSTSGELSQNDGTAASDRGRTAGNSDTGAEETGEIAPINEPTDGYILSERDKQAIELSTISQLKNFARIPKANLAILDRAEKTRDLKESEVAQRSKDRAWLKAVEDSLSQKEKIKKHNKWGVKSGNHPVPLDTAKAMFAEWNEDADIQALFDRVFETFSKLGINITFEDNIGSGTTQGWFSISENRVKLPMHLIYSDRYIGQKKASIMLHEMIHGVAQYVLAAAEMTEEARSKRGIILSDGMMEAAKQLSDIYSIIKKDKRFKGQYGLTDVHEMVSELAEPEFRALLKETSIWQQIVDALKKLLRIDVENNALEGVSRALDYILDNYDADLYKKVSKIARNGKPTVNWFEMAEQVKAEREANAEKSVEEGLEAKEARVYHGSGSLFDKFNHSFMSTGEGNRVFGWGTYVSESNGVAEVYAGIAYDNKNRNAVQAQEWLSKNPDYKTFIEQGEGKRRLDDIETAKAFYGEQIKDAEDRGDVAQAEELRRFLDDEIRSREYEISERRYNEVRDLFQAQAGGRYIYNVEIPDDNGKNYLKWYEDVPKSIRAKVKQKLFAQLMKDGAYGNAVRELSEELNDVFGYEQSGGVLYGNLAAYLGGDRAASEFLHEMGYVGLKYPTNTLHGGNIDGTNNYVIFDENDLEIVDNIRFRDGAPFFSNAERAVENIKQNKATPEQWLAMIKKDGGLKAGEDYNAIAEKIDDAWDDYVYEAQRGIVSYGQYRELDDVPMEQVQYYVREKIKDIYGDDIFDHIEIDEDGNVFVLGDTKPINSTRLDYTTEGLENKKEIAFVVPTIEPWNQADNIHFGDAGEGRAVAWVRFGETTDADGKRVLVIDEVQSKRHDEGRSKGYSDLRDYDKKMAALEEEAAELLARRNKLIKVLDEKYGGFTKYLKHSFNGQRTSLVPNPSVMTAEEIKEWNETSQDSIREREDELKKQKRGVPDAPFDKNYSELVMKRMLRYAAENGFDKVAWTKGVQQAKRYGLNKVVDTIDASNFNSDTERDIRLTYTNEQQDNLLVRMSDGVVVKGDINGSSVEGQKLSDIIGKDAADKLLSTTDDMDIKAEGLSFGGEDRNALYDEMIPRFMNKYVKKWGTKVGEVTLPEVEEAGRTMWSVNVTPEMRESVMQGQPMFREGMGAISDREVSYENDPIAKWDGKPRYYGKRAAAFAERERRRMQKGVENAAKILGIEVEIITDASALQGRKAKAKGWYDIINKKVVVVVPNHVSKGDAVRTVLHEGIAHHGLRELFGAGFDAMLDNIYNNVAPELKARIDAIAERTGVSTSVATEEYLASLAEDTEFEYAYKMGWWDKIKRYFVDMLRKLSMPGLNLKEEITDNELRFLLWRSYQNLVDPNRYLKPLGYIDDVAKQKELKVGNYAENTMATPRVAEMSEAEGWSAITMQRIEELEAQMAQLDSEIAEMEADRDADDESRYDMWEDQLDVLRKQSQEIYDELEGLYSLEAEDEDIEEYEAKREAEKQRQLYQKRIDNAYLKAVREGNWEEATDLFRQYVLSKAEDEGIVPMDYGVGYRGGAHSSIAKKVKEENPDAIAEAAYQMSIRIPKGSILVPMPSRTGNATYTVKLAEAIAKATDSEVRDVLKGKARMSVYEAKQKGIKMTPEDLGMYTTEELPKGRNIVIIDNVIDKGTTALAAVSAVKGASVVAYAYTLGDKQRAATLKLAEPVTYDDNKRIIPLSQRFNKETDDIRYRNADEIIAEVEREAAALGVPVRIVRSVDELPDEDTRKRAVDGQLKGYFDPRTGEVALYEPNTNDANDAKRTILHETVGHKGLRQLIGEERYDKAMVQLMYMLPSEVRDAVLRRAERHGWNAAIAMDEYLADQAERDVQPTWWGKVNAKIRALLRNMGFNVMLTDADVTYLIWRSRKKLMGDTAFDMATNAILKQAARKSAEADAWNEQAFKDAEMRNFEKGAMQRLRNRIGDAQNEYDSAMKTMAFKQRESWQDSMRSLKVFMDVVSKESGKKIADFENAYMYENAMSSANRMEMQMFRHDVYGRLLKAIHELMENGAKHEEVVDYMMAKHGLERNEKMARKRAEKEAEGDAAKEAALYAKYRDEDLSGLTALTGVDNVADAEAAAMQMVSDFEAKHNTDLLWNETRACTQTILNISHDAGILSDEVYDELWNQYEYYIPLRGFDETTAEEVYTYVGDSKSPYNAPIKTAKGRKSKADNPIATIATMAESAIVEANRNRLKQRFLYMVERHRTELASVSSVWVEKDPITGDCVARFANIPNDATPEEAAARQKAFERRMEKNAEENPSKFKKISEKNNIPYRVEKKANEHEHQVIVKRNGKDVVITINGDPRVAQAINGLTNPEAVKGFDKVAGNVNRFLSANYTTRNPAFVVCNFVRDGFYTNNMVWVKESPAYAWKYNQNWAKATKLLPSLVRKYKRYEKGDKSALDMSDPAERAFYDFMINGGETGYTVINSVEDYKGIVAGDLKTMQGGVIGNTKKAVQAVGEVLDTFGRWAEDTSRFAAFLTSREMGRSLTKSIWDAKEISVNFNKKGSGRKMTQHDKGLNSLLGWMSQQGRNLFVFWNASMQGMFNFSKAVKEHPGKMAGLVGVYFGLGMAIAAIFGGHDDDEDYWNLPEYVRRNNICFRVGNKFVTLPLPIELRAIYGMGELAMSWMAGKEDPKKVGMKVVQQMSQVLPIDMMAEGGGLKAFIPSWGKPIFEVGVNTDWTGMPIYRERTPWNEHDPQWMLAFKSTSPELVAASRAINEATNKNLPSGKENKYDSGWADIEYLNNPAAWEHVVEGYLGGLATMFNQTKKSVMAIWNEDLREVRNIPVVSRFVKDTGEKSEEYALREDYFNAKGVVDELRSQRGHFRKESIDPSLTEEQRKDVMDSRIEMEKMVNATISQWNSLENARKKLEDMVKDNPDQEVTFDGKKGNAKDALDEVTRRMVKLTEGYQ